MYPRCFLGMDNIAVSKRNKILVPMDVILWQGIETITFSEINPKTKKKNTKISTVSNSNKSYLFKRYKC